MKLHANDSGSDLGRVTAWDDAFIEIVLVVDKLKARLRPLAAALQRARADGPRAVIVAEFNILVVDPIKIGRRLSHKRG